MRRRVRFSQPDSDWAQKGSPPMRAAVLHCFDNPFVRPHLGFLLDRWDVETYRAASENLVQILARRIDNRHASRAFEIAQAKTDSGICLLLAKLCRMRATEHMAKQAILAEFAAGNVSYYKLVAYSRVKDPNIQACYEPYVNSPDRYTRSLAQRVLGISIPKAQHLIKSPAGPPRGEPHEVYSIEIDIDRARPILEAIAERFRIPIPPSVMDGTSLEALARDKWYRLRGPVPDSAYQLWFRQEDFDIVEVVVTA